MSDSTGGPSRRTLIIAGAGVAAAGIGTFAISRGGFAVGNANQSTSHSFEDSTLCVVTASFTEGPFYVDDAAVRSDIREDRKGLATTLKLKVVDANGCVPLPGAIVDAWHCDAAGNYSATGTRGAARFLRGRQLADASGFVTFETIYPGWYTGRAPHIHLKVQLGGREAVTTQLFFAEQLSDEVYAAAPYVARDLPRTTNAQDGLLAWAQGANGVWPKMTRRNDGLMGTLTLGVTRA